MDADFGRWLQECFEDLAFPNLGVGCNEIASKFTTNVTISERTLRRYCNGQSSPVEAKNAYAVGWALHDSGIAWCSGPVALFAAGHISPAFGLLAALSKDDDHKGRDVALRFAFAGLAAAACKPITLDEALGVKGDANSARVLPTESLDDRLREYFRLAEQERDYARLTVAEAARQRDRIDEAYSCAFESHYQSSEDFRVAEGIIVSTQCPELARIRWALAVLRESVRFGPHKDEATLVDELCWLSPIAVSAA